jgi:hypothetical protein
LEKLSEYEMRDEMRELKGAESQWTKKGATLSHKNACQEFGLTEDG